MLSRYTKINLLLSTVDTMQSKKSLQEFFAPQYSATELPGHLS